MDFTSTILAAAKAAHVSGTLLLAICGHESRDFTLDFNQYDNGSPSLGVCQVKEDTARMLGFKGQTVQLMNPRISAYWAAQYLKYQQTRYGEHNWCTLAAAYNAGSFLESERSPGYPKNLKYVKLVQQKLPKHLQQKLSCTPQGEGDAD